MAAGLHMPEAKRLERSGRRAVMAVGGLMGAASGGPAFTTIHIGAFRPLERRPRIADSSSAVELWPDRPFVVSKGLPHPLTGRPLLEERCVFLFWITLLASALSASAARADECDAMAVEIAGRIGFDAGSRTASNVISLTARTEEEDDYGAFPTATERSG